MDIQKGGRSLPGVRSRHLPRQGRSSPTTPSRATSSHFAANFNKFPAFLKRLHHHQLRWVAHRRAASRCSPEYDEGNSKRQKLKGAGRHPGPGARRGRDGAATITDVELFPSSANQAAWKALQGDDEYPGGDFRSLNASRPWKRPTSWSPTRPSLSRVYRPTRDGTAKASAL